MQTRIKLQAAVTLIELLCVITIILILMGLLLGPVLRAYRKVQGFAGEIEGSAVVEMAVNRLRRFHQEHTTYGVLTADYLHKQAIFDSKFMQYMRQKKVIYYAFSSSDPDQNPVIWYTFSKDEGGLILKSNITAAALSRY